MNSPSDRSGDQKRCPMRRKPSITKATKSAQNLP
jgi:hypothetical protein